MRPIVLSSSQQRRLERLARDAGCSSTQVLKFVLRDGFDYCERQVRESLASDADAKTAGVASHQDAMREVRGTVRKHATNQTPNSRNNLGSRIASRFARRGLVLDIPEIRGQQPRPALFGRREWQITKILDELREANRERPISHGRLKMKWTKRYARVVARSRNLPFMKALTTKSKKSRPRRGLARGPT